jgi:hypothetical protein
MPEHDVPARHPPGHLADDHGAGAQNAPEPAWVHSHSHAPNLQTPGGDGDFVVIMPGGSRQTFAPVDLKALPYTVVANCLIVSTGHGTSGPFTFGGARLGDLLDAVLSTHAPYHAKLDSEMSENTVADRGEYRGEGRGEGRSMPIQAPSWQYVDLVSADGFGTRLTRADLAATEDRPVLLAYAKDGMPLTRAQGLVRLIVPSETDDALRQVKWLATITIV